MLKGLLMIELTENALPLNGGRGCVLTIGNFDGVHIGHRTLIQKTVALASELGLPSVVWSFGRHPQSYFGGNRLLYLAGACEKHRLIAALGADMYFPADFAKYRDMSEKRFVDEVLVSAFGVRAVLCGYNFSFGKGGKGTPRQLEQLLASHGVPLYVLPAVCCDGTVVSSTGLRALIQSGDVAAARRQLGHCYGFCLPVTGGNRLGHRIGTPTANQRFPADRVVPAYGVYASFCRIDGRLYRAVSDVGVKPTVCSGTEAPVCETHIFGFDGELYGQELWVYLYERIREERRFESVEALAAQIADDKVAALKITEGITDV